MLELLFSNLTSIISILQAEVPGAARVNLQPAEHLKKCVLQLLGFQAPEAQGVRGRESNLGQNLPWTGGDVCGKFYQDRCRGLDFH